MFLAADADSVVEGSLTTAGSSGLPRLRRCPTYQWNLEKESNRKKHMDLPSAELVAHVRPSLQNTYSEADLLLLLSEDGVLDNPQLFSSFVSHRIELSSCPFSEDGGRSFAPIAVIERGSHGTYILYLLAN